jgi:hypothetical protein
MTLLEQLQSHRGGLIKLKTELFWYDGRGWDNNPGRICLLLDVVATTNAAAAVACTTAASSTAASPATTAAAEATTAAALLLIDGKPQWIWIAEKDVEVINESR